MRKIRKMPKYSTIRAKINYYAYRVGFTIVKEGDKYHIFDNIVGYYTLKSVDLDCVHRTVYDSLYAKIASENRSLV